MNKSGSILIWTIFLSLFISAFFIVFQSGISKYLTLSSIYNKNIEISSNLDDILFGLKGNPQAYKSIDSVYSIESIDYNGQSFSGFLDYNEATEYWIPNSGGTNTITGSIISGGPILYKLIAFTGASINAIISSSGIIESLSGINLKFDSSYNYNILYIQSLGGFSNFNITKGKSDLLSAKNIYKLTRDVYGYKQFLQNFEITNFGLKSFPGLDYESFGMYLNTK